MNNRYKKLLEEITKELQKNIQTINSDNTQINDFNIETEQNMITGITKFKYTVTYTTKNPLNQENNKTGE